MDLIPSEGTSNNAFAVIQTGALRTELEARGRDLERYVKNFVSIRDDGQTKVTISPEALKYLAKIGSRSRLNQLARAMPYAHANGRSRIETHHFAMAAISPERLTGDGGVAAIYQWHKDNGVKSQSHNLPSLRLPSADD